MSSPKSIEQADVKLQASNIRFSVFTKSKGIVTLVHENNRLQEAGYYIYKNYADKLETLTVFIKRNDDNQILKIVTKSESESMIGVHHPIDGHIGYLTVEEIKAI